MARIGFLIILILGVINLCNAQTPEPVSQTQLLNLQSLTQKEIFNFLTDQGWKVERNQRNQLSEYFNYSMGYFSDKWGTRKI